MRVGFLLESLDFQTSGAARAVARMAHALNSSGQLEAVLIGPEDKFVHGPLATELEINKITLKARRKSWNSSVSRYQELAESVPKIARGLTDVVVACGKFQDSDVYWSHNGVHEANLQCAAAAGRGPANAWISLQLKRVRGLEKLYAELEQSARDRVLQGSLKLAALSDMVAQDYVNYWGIPRESISIVGNICASTAHSSSMSYRDSKDELRCLFVAMNPRLKGANELKAWRRKHPELQLCIDWYGSNPGPLTGTDNYRGVVNEIDFSSYHLLIAPTHYDPCSLVTIEAIASQCPVLSTPRNGALSEFKHCQFDLKSGEFFAKLAQLTKREEYLSYRKAFIERCDTAMIAKRGEAEQRMSQLLLGL